MFYKKESIPFTPRVCLTGRKSDLKSVKPTFNKYRLPDCSVQGVVPSGGGIHFFQIAEDSYNPSGL